MKTSRMLLLSFLFLFSAVAHIFAQRVNKKVTVTNFYGVNIDAGDSIVKCRSIPFRASHASNRSNTTRVREGLKEMIPIGGATAEKIYFLGMINYGWDYGLAHWGEHFELHKTREDQIQIGKKLGDIEIVYQDGSSDIIPAVVGFTLWFFNQWKYPSHDAGRVIREPFASRSEYQEILDDALQLKEQGEYMEVEDNYRAYYLAVTPRNKAIKSIVVHDILETRGQILVSGVTLQLSKVTDIPDNLYYFGTQRVDKKDTDSAFQSFDIPDYRQKVDKLAGILYNSNKDLPVKVNLLSFPQSMKAACIRFLSDQVEGDMLSNIWVANLINIDEKFDTETGCFYETGVGSPFYGGYQGIGTWEPVGVYREPYSRTTDHYVRQALRCIDNEDRITNFVDYCDKWLYFYRSDNDPSNGPDNSAIDFNRYPETAPPHWAFVMNGPAAAPYEINEIPGCEEMEGHSSTIVGRWFAWKLIGKPNGEWMTQSRDEVYRKSRWDSSKDAADFICWLMDYTGRDVIYSEGEFTGWAQKFGKISQIPEGMDTETYPIKIRENYANSDMYEVYASYTSMVALQCTAEMAEIMGDPLLAAKYQRYAGRIRSGMLRLLAIGSDHYRMWRVARNSVLPSLQYCLVHAWFSLYREGLDPTKMDQDMASITNNTLDRQLAERYGDAPVLAMGYGIGWLTHSALVMDRMDNAGRLLTSIARYTYDKNMDYDDPSRGIEWSKWLWIIPEGVNIMPDGRWYRICDLSNGANQGPAMNALEMCAGVDDSYSGRLRLLPRIPDPLNGLEISDYTVMSEDAGINTNVKIEYRYDRGKKFSFKSSKLIPLLDIRFGPYSSNIEADKIISAIQNKGGCNVRWEYSGVYRGMPAIWVWAENLTDVAEYNLEFTGL